MNAADTKPLADVLIGAPDDEIVTLEARIRSAQLDADVAALDDLIHEDLLFTGPDGTLGTKAQDLAAHGSGVIRFREHVPVELRIRRVGQAVAVVALLTQLAVEFGGGIVRGAYRYTRIWARDADGAWRVVGGHVSAVPVGST